MRKLISLVFFSLLCSVMVMAQGFKFIPVRFNAKVESSRLANWGTPGVYNDTLPLAVFDQWDDWVAKRNGVATNTAYSFKSIQDYIRVGINHDTALVTPAYKYEIHLNVLVYGTNDPSFGHVAVSQFPVSIRFSYNPDSLQQYNDLSVYKFSDLLKYQVVVTGIYDVSGQNPVLIPKANIARNFFVDCVMEEQKYDQNPFNLYTNAYGYNNNLFISWQPVPTSFHGCTAPLQTVEVNPIEYELEWTYIDDYHVNTANNGSPTMGFPNNSAPYDFRKNSTRVRVSGLTYALPILYEHGAIVYRVRSLRPDPATNYKDVIYSSWSLNDYGQADLNSSCAPGYAYAITNAHMNDSLNWQYTINFAEEGKYKHVINYFDGSLKERQTQTKINTDNNYVVAVEKAYDFEGRPSIMSLPVPVLQQNLNYRNDVLLNDSSGKPYKASDFDYGCIEPRPDSIAPLSTLSKAYLYYSGLNPDQNGMQKFVPDAQGYPFVQTIYSPDNTNKVIWQGGAGRMHQLWKGHGTKYEYVRATQQEIDRLLGTEAGQYQYYPKQVVTDPNGQTSFSIMNPAGKVVATGLLGDVNTVDQPLVHLDNFVNATSDITDLLHNTTQNKSNGVLSAENSFFSDNSGLNALDYSVSVPPFATGCSGYNLYTKAKYTVKVTNECGEPFMAIGSGILPDMAIYDSVGTVRTTVLSNADYSRHPQVSAILQKAKYLVKKDLTFSQADINSQVNQFIRAQSPTCYNDSNYFIKQAVNAASFPCISDPELNPCDVKRKEMIRELYPNAKYGRYNKNNDSSFFAGVSNSIFSEISEQIAPGSSGGSGTGTTDVCVWQYPAVPSGGWAANGITQLNIICSYGCGHHLKIETNGTYSGSGLGHHHNHDCTTIFSDASTTPCDPCALKQGTVTKYGTPSALLGTCEVYWTCQYNQRHSVPEIPCSPQVWNGTILPGSRYYGNFSNVYYDDPQHHTGCSVQVKTWLRYQDPCITLPSSVTYNGVQYTNLKSLPVDTLIKIFNDDIAAALLPLHPEYCKLQVCDDGSFQKTLNNLQTFQQAEAAGLFNLNDIIAQDPLYTGSPTQAQHDKLAYLKNAASNIGLTLDLTALSAAYCGGGNHDEYMGCFIGMYSDQINNLTFINDGVKQKYFTLLKNLYIGNRSYIKQQIYDGTANTCQSCSAARMDQIGNPVFPSVFDASGNVSASVSGLPSWIVDALNTTTSSPATIPSGVSQNASQNNQGQIQAQVDAVIADLRNCTTDDVVLNGIRTNLISALSGGAKLNPTTIMLAIPPGMMNDLCHPFLTEYGIFDNPSTVGNFACGSSELYDGLKSMLNRPEIKAVIQNNGSNNNITLSPSTNAFEKKLAAYLSDPTNIQVTSQVTTLGTATNTNYIQLQFKRQIIGSINFAYANFYIRQQNATDPLINNGAMSVITASCINSEPTADKTGIVAQRTALIDATVGGTLRRYYIWNDAVDIMQDITDGSLNACITCVDMKNALNSFETDKGGFLYDNNFNHPLYEKTLTNYLNYKLNKQYTFDDYYQLMNGCAITDQNTIKRYAATFKITVSSSNISAILTSIANATKGRELITYQVQHTNTGDVDLYLDLNILPADSILWYKNAILTAAQSATVYYLPYLPTMLFSKNNSIVISPAYGNFVAEPVRVYENGAYTDYTLYTRNSSNYNSAADRAQSLDGIKGLLQVNGGFAFYDAQLLRSADFNTAAKQAYLNYVYSQPAGASHTDIIGAIDTAILKTQLSVFSGKKLTYEDPYCTSLKTDLYSYTQPGYTHPGFAFLDLILNGMAAANGQKLFPASTFHWVNSDPQNYTETDVYKKANGVYWYKVFDKNKRLRNVYLVPPSYVPDLSAYNFTPFTSVWEIAQGDDSAKSFNVYLKNGTKTIVCRGYTDFPIGYAQKLQNVVLFKDANNMSCFDSLDCEHDHLMDAVHNGQIAFQQYFDSLNKDMSGRMMAYLLDNTKDTLKLTYQNEKYQYTLYYYDRAGNLTRTVPPEGVNVLPDNQLTAIDNDRNSSTVSTSTLPAHKKVSIYTYNSLNQLTFQQTPDGGATYFFYDKVGRLVFSQNSKQRPKGDYSYTLYDPQGRSKETGEITLGCTFTDNPGILFDTLQCQFPNSQTGQNSPHPDYVQNANMYTMDQIDLYVRTKVRRSVVITIYDTATVDLGAIANEHLSTQENLRKRVSTIFYFPSIGNTYSTAIWNSYVANPYFATYYSYDLNGNVKTVTYGFKQLNYIKQRYKRVDYDYDLLSGKVNAVSYNRNRADQFYHKYEYDADNRITKVYTSNDGIIWNTDARYNYYKHGPLAQTQIGDNYIQSLEYAYTIQGWLKAINGDVRRPDLEMGKNGMPGDLGYARDAIAHALDYFGQDYKPIGGAAATVTNLQPITQNLYNGNIVRQTTAIGGLGNMQRTYQYDQLQRLKLASNSMINEATLVAVNPSPSDIYKSSYSYDQDGNIKTLKRWSGSATGNGTNPDIDNFAYTYTTGGTDNKLQQVTDNAPATTGTDLQPGQAAGNYQYDKLGNLVKDVQGNLRMTWNLYGKVDSIINTSSGQKTILTYDGAGNRIYKEVVTPQGGSAELHNGEYYVRDAQGNILAVYADHSKYALLPLIKMINADIKLQAGLSAFTQFVQADVSSQPSFSTQLTNYALASMPTWSASITDAFPIRSYLLAPSDMMNRMLFGNFTYLSPLQAYAKSINTNIISGAMLADKENIPTIFNQCLLFDGVSQETMLQFQLTMPIDYTKQLWAQNGAAYSDIPATSATNFVNTMKQKKNQTQVAGWMYTYVQKDNAQYGGKDALNYYNTILGDDKIMSAAQLRTNGSVFEKALSASLNNYGNYNNLAAFYNQWDPSRGILNASSSISQRFGIVYNDNPSNTISGFLGNSTDDGIATVTASIPGMTMSGFTNMVSASRTLGGYSYTLPSVINEVNIGNSIDTFSLAEHHIYGSSRLGLHHYDFGTIANTWAYDAANLPAAKTALSDPQPWYSCSFGDLVSSPKKDPWGNRDVTGYFLARTVGNRNYEMTDHLGNVLATALDRKTGHVSGVPTLYDYYQPDLASVQDYYPGGMLMPGRNINADKFRFGAQKQQKDDEIYGSGNEYAFKYRMEDARLNRFWSVDPLAKQYPYNSSYAFGENRLIDRRELEGLETAPVEVEAETPVLERGTDPIPEGSPRYFGGRTGPITNTEPIKYAAPDNTGAGASAAFWNDLVRIFTPKRSVKMPTMEETIAAMNSFKGKFQNSSTPFERIATDINHLSEQDRADISQRITSGNATLQDLIYAGQLGWGTTSRNNFSAPDIYKDRHGKLTNGLYTIDETGMDRHTNGDYTTGKSQFKYGINAEKVVLDAAAYADKNNLWGGSDNAKAKVYIKDGVVGYSNGVPTQWINVYRTKTGQVHGSPTDTPGKTQ